MTDVSPTVSVIIPTYNRARFIGQAVTSALGQTYDELEVIVVDDGSADETEEVIKSFSDSRLRYHRLEKNEGRSRARNIGLGLARGRYLSFLDSDDYFLPFKTEMQVRFMEEHPNVDMIYTASACVDESDRPLQYFYRAPFSGRIYNEIAFFKPLTITLPTVMLRRKVVDEIGLFDDKMERFEDTDYWRRAAKKFDIAAIDEVTCHIRSHDENHIGSFDPKSFEHAIDYYVEKVFREDAEIDPLILQAGARRLYDLYASALAGIPNASEICAKLTHKGRAAFYPLVSIIIPVYNGSNYLSKAIDSALAQTYRNLEIIVVNDGSSDAGETENVALSYGQKIRYFSKPNGGCASALNTAILEARGQYITWLSHDDLFTPDKIDHQVAFLAQQPDPTSSIVYGDYSVFFGSGPISKRRACVMPNVLPKDFRYFLTTHNILHGCSLLIPAKAFERHGLFDESLETVLDFDMWFKMAKTERFVYRPGVVVHARAHPDQDTNRKSDIHMREANELLMRFASELSPDEVRSGASSSLAQGYYRIAATLQRRNFIEAATHAIKLAEDTIMAPVRRLASTGGESNEAFHEAEGALAEIFAILRSCVRSGDPAPFAPGQEQADSYEAHEATGTSTAQRILFRMIDKATRTKMFVHLVRAVTASPRLQLIVRRAIRRLPVGLQIRLATIAGRVRS